jgi:hypothetical protein
MPGDTKEPQSYGSGEDWVTGQTDQKVNANKSAPPPQHRDFYDSKRDSEASAPDQGGKTSDVQLAESATPIGSEGASAKESARGMSSEDGGARRDSFFKRRDYD